MKVAPFVIKTIRGTFIHKHCIRVVSDSRASLTYLLYLFCTVVCRDGVLEDTSMTKFCGLGLGLDDARPWLWLLAGDLAVRR